MAVPSLTWRKSSGFRASAPIGGSLDSGPKARPVCSTGPRDPSTARGAPRPKSSSECSSYGSSSAAARTGSGPELGIPARTVSAILRRHDVPRLAECDPLTGEVIRASKTTSVRYERSTPGDLIHVDVKKVGRIPDGGGWRARGRSETSEQRHKRVKIGYGLPPRRRRRPFTPGLCRDPRRRDWRDLRNIPTTRCGVLRRPRRGNPRGDQRQRSELHPLARLRRGHRADRRPAPHHQAPLPLQNGKVERFNRTVQIEWAYRQVFDSNAARAAALEPWLDFYNTPRRHSAIGGTPPISRLS